MHGGFAFLRPGSGLPEVSLSGPYGFSCVRLSYLVFNVPLFLITILTSFPKQMQVHSNGNSNFFFEWHTEWAGHNVTAHSSSLFPRDPAVSAGESMEL